MASNKTQAIIATSIYLVIFTVSIIVLYPYIEIGLWATIIVVSVWPAYKYWCSLFKKYHKLAALTFTLIVAIVILLPIAWVTYIAINELISFIHIVQQGHTKDFILPPHIAHLPYVGTYIEKFWDTYINNPEQLKKLLPAASSVYAKAGQVALLTMKLAIQFVFMLLLVFFMFLHGDNLSKKSQAIIQNNSPRFSTYLEKAILVIRSVLTSMVYSGLTTGVVLGSLFYYYHVPLAAFFGIMSMLSTVIPFGIGALLVVVSIILIIQANFTGFIVIAIVGMAISILVDSFIRPSIIEKSVSMHFLAAFFGALGGIEAFGIIGIYLGPIIMMLLTLIWQEMTLKQKETQA